jgi:hypothetical protein
LLQIPLQMQQKGDGAALGQRSAAACKKPADAGGAGNGVAEKETGRWLQIRCKCSQRVVLGGCDERVEAVFAILVSPAAATTSEGRVFGDRR